MNGTDFVMVLAYLIVGSIFTYSVYAYARMRVEKQNAQDVPTVFIYKVFQCWYTMAFYEWIFVLTLLWPLIFVAYVFHKICDVESL